MAEPWVARVPTADHRGGHPRRRGILRSVPRRPLTILFALGVAGCTLGGGTGHLARKYGLSLDNLISADVVAADGSFVHASEDENEDLFWGLRGGGGNFGVVTSFEFQLHEVGPEVLAGQILRPMADATEGLAWLSPWHHYIATDPVGGGLDLGSAALLTILAVVPVAAGVALFKRRDIAA